ncbi:MAG: hypothetical protein ACPL5F_11020 [Moorellaceae bacterium]
MAKVTAPLMSLDASGSVGKTLVFAKWKGVNYARKYFVPANPDTANQGRIRNYFTQAVHSWHQESKEVKERWNLAVRGQPLTGFNHYVSQYISYLLAHEGQTPATPFLPPGSV